MADTDHDAGAGAGAADTVADLEPGSLDWRVAVANGAHQFFKMPHDGDIAAAIGKTLHPTNFEAWTVADFSRYLHTQGLRDAGKVAALTQITRAMERVGFLMPCGNAPIPIMGETYLTQGGASPGQVGGLPTAPEERIEFLEQQVADLTAKTFAHGIPSSEVIRALDDLGFGGLAKLDDVPPGSSPVFFRNG